MATLGSRMVNEPSPITTEPTDFALQGHRPCQHCGYDLVGTPIERAVDLEIAVIRCPECGNLNPLIGTPPLGPFAQRAAMVGTLVRLLLIGLTSIILWAVAFNSVEEWGKSMYRSQANQGLVAFFQSNGDTPEEQQALEVHFKKKPGTFLTGLYYKQYFDEQSGYYTMLGYSAFVDTDRFNLGSGYQVHSINVGAGYRFTELESNYLVPLELGFGPACHNIKKTIGLNGFAGFASYYRLQ